MKKTKRPIWIGLIILLVITLITFIAAPSSNKIYTGSTYNRSPGGYGAWYAFMEQQNVKIIRWQKPFKSLKEEIGNDNSPVTLLQVYGNLRPLFLYPQEKEWVKTGNTLIRLGINQPVTKAEFTTMLEYDAQNVKIETRRRHQVNKNEESSLKDDFGAVVWQEKLGKGKVVYSTTPFIAANAYQDYPNNFRYLADLVKKGKNTIYVDEYIHGYKDNQVQETEGKGSLFGYFTQTPLFTALIQLGIVLLVIIWTQNRRFGKPITLKTRVVDNSEEYIQALAQVLEKADCTQFVVETIGKQEQLHLQKALSLGQQLLDKQIVINAWIEQIKSPTTQLNEVLSIQNRKRPISERQLLSWLKKWQAVHQEVEKFQNSSAPTL